MCELLGMSFNLPIRPSISFRGFRHRGEANPHGWGLAFYPDESAQVIKEPIKARKSPLSSFLKDYSDVISKIFVAHVRYTSVSAKTHKNTHPFYRELNGKEYVFAHNGTLHNYSNLELGRFKPIGETDSEYVFCHLLGCIEETDITRWEGEDFRWFAEKLREINNYGTFNCIFSDGASLFCYYDKNRYNGLCFAHRKPPYDTIRLLDEDWEINLAEEKDPNQTGFVVATKPLTNESWESFRPGELIVFKNGRMIYSNIRAISEFYSASFTDLDLKILKILRTSPNKLSLGEITIETGCPTNDIKSSIHSLLRRGYIRQDRRDGVKWNRDNATFYTNTTKRKEIDGLIR